jgi:hypothetical protein
MHTKLSDAGRSLQPSAAIMRGDIGESEHAGYGERDPEGVDEPAGSPDASEFSFFVLGGGDVSILSGHSGRA